MALEAYRESLENLPESVQEQYQPTEDGSGYILSVDPNGTNYQLEDISGLQSALSKERGQNKELNKKLKQFGDLDPNDIQEKLQRLEEFENMDVNSEAEKIAEKKAQSQIEQIKQKSQEEMQSVQQQLDQYRTKLEEKTIDQAAHEALLEAGGDDSTLKLITPQLRNNMRLNDNLEPEIVDKEGNVRIGDAQGNPMSLKQLAEEYKKEFPQAFPGRNKSGSGAPSGQGNQNNGPQGKRRSQMSRQEKAQFVDEHGQEEYFNLPE